MEHITVQLRRIFTFMVLTGASLGAGSATITLNPSKTYQTMTGWEATAWAMQTSPAFPNFKDELYDLAVYDLGINRLRLEIRSGSENSQDNWTAYQNGDIPYETWRSRRYSTINGNDDPAVLNRNGFHFSEVDDVVEKIVLPLKQRVEANGEELFVNLNYVAFTGQIGAELRYHHDDPEEYAEFMLAAFLHMHETYGWVPDTIEVLLEPDNVSQWNGTLLGRTIVATQARLQANGFAPRFIAPSNTNMGRAVSYFDAMIQIPGVLAHLEEFSYHRYGGVSDANLQAIASRAVQHNLRTSMLEWWNGNNGYKILHKDLSMGRNSAWQQAVVNGHYDIDDGNPDNPVIRIKRATKFTRQYFKFIRRGAVRTTATSSTGIFDPLAFINADGGYVVVVKAASRGTFLIEGLPAGTYGIKYTTDSVYDVDLPDVTPGQPVTATMPAAGVITIYAKATPQTPFKRGDANAGGELDLADAVYTLTYLFSNGSPPPCLDAADTNDDGIADLSDPIAALMHLFAGPIQIPEPFAQCATDPTPDTLSCESFPPCQ
jgi:O-glycosyl hydrolase